MEATADSSAATPSPSAPSAPGQRSVWKTIGFVVFGVYLIALFVLALDQNLHWDLFPTAADKEISAKILQLGDTSLSQGKRDAISQDIVNWNTFAVPALLKAIEKGPPAVHDPALKCLQTISLKFYNQDITKYGTDPTKLKEWWAGVQADWAKTANEKQ